MATTTPPSGAPLPPPPQLYFAAPEILAHMIIMPVVVLVLMPTGAFLAFCGRRVGTFMLSLPFGQKGTMKPVAAEDDRETGIDPSARQGREGILELDAGDDSLTNPLAARFLFLPTWWRTHILLQTISCVLLMGAACLVIFNTTYYCSRPHRIVGRVLLTMTALQLGLGMARAWRVTRGEWLCIILRIHQCLAAAILLLAWVQVPLGIQHFAPLPTQPHPYWIIYWLALTFWICVMALVAFRTWQGRRLQNDAAAWSDPKLQTGPNLFGWLRNAHIQLKEADYPREGTDQTWQPSQTTLTRGCHLTEQLPVIDWEQFNEAILDNGQFLVLGPDGLVCDIGSLVTRHPGGHTLLLDAIGTDVTADLDGGQIDGKDARSPNCNNGSLSNANDFDRDYEVPPPPRHVHSHVARRTFENLSVARIEPLDPPAPYCSFRRFRARVISTDVDKFILLELTPLHVRTDDTRTSINAHAQYVTLRVRDRGGRWALTDHAAVPMAEAPRTLQPMDHPTTPDGGQSPITAASTTSADQWLGMHFGGTHGSLARFRITIPVAQLAACGLPNLLTKPCADHDVPDADTLQVVQIAGPRHAPLGATLRAPAADDALVSEQACATLGHAVVHDS